MSVTKNLLSEQDEKEILIMAEELKQAIEELSDDDNDGGFEPLELKITKHKSDKDLTR